MKEKNFQNLISQDLNLQKSILEAIGILNLDIKFNPEFRLENGLIVDFNLTKDNIIYAMIETKGDEIGLNEFVRGLGQADQYWSYLEEKKFLKGYEVFHNFSVIILFPSELVMTLKIHDLNINSKITLLEYNDFTKSVRRLNLSDLRKIRSASNKGLKTISQYYFRDNRIFELYILLKFLSFQKLKGLEKIDRKSTESDFLKLIGTPNNNNWRNAFITLSSLGLIDNRNLPTKQGVLLADENYEDFLHDVAFGYMREYIVTIFEAIESITKTTTLKISNKELNNVIRELNGVTDILFLTESNERYISSWLNILKDDFGAIAFNSRDNKRTIHYNPMNLNKYSFKKFVRDYSKAYRHIDKFLSLLKS